MSVPLIAYHANCPDGYGSAWWLGRAIGAHEKVACFYDKPFPDCTDRDVYSVDFCPKADALNQAVLQCRTLTILDHHASQVAEVRLSDHVKLFDTINDMLAVRAEMRGYSAVMDMDHSGVGLAAEFVYKHYGTHDEPDWFINIEDRDLWRFKYGDQTRNVFAAVTARRYCDEDWDAMYEMSADELAMEGRGVEMYRQRLIEQTLETAHLITLPIFGEGGLQVFEAEIEAAAAPYAICSDVAGELAKRSHMGVGATYVDYGNRRKYSLRSTEAGPDVSKIAQAMDPTGGGHVHSAGAMVYL